MTPPENRGRVSRFVLGYLFSDPVLFDFTCVPFLCWDKKVRGTRKSRQ